MEENYFSSDDGNETEDVSLPKGKLDVLYGIATVAKLIQERLPSDIACSKESRDLIIACCVANEICDKDSKKTISPEHICAALENLGFADYISEVRSAYEDHKSSLKDREKKIHRLDASGLTEEELQRQQEELFEKARLKYMALSQTTKPSDTNS